MLQPNSAKPELNTLCRRVTLGDLFDCDSCMDVSPDTLPELAFWALFHCRHARPPDALLLR